MTPPALPSLRPRWRRSVAALFVAAAAGFMPAVASAQSFSTSQSAARLPTLGDAAREDLSPIVERKLGEAIMREIRRDRDYLDDDAIAEYLNNFGGALVDAAPGARGETNADFYFFPLRDGSINAFALPGGFIGIHSGLLLAAQTESELASVVSHEIGHVSQRHIARMLGQQRQDALLPIAALILAALAAKASPDAAMGVMMGGQGLAVQRQLNFSRDAEREADRVGFQIMSAGGYDTSGMVAFFKRLQSVSKVYGEIPAFLSSHPLTSERIVDIQARIKETPYRQRPDPIEFYIAKARARVLQDMSTTGRRDTRTAFQTQLAQQHRQQQAAAQYGLSFLALKESDLAGARSWYDKARATLKAKEGTFSAAPANDGGALFAVLDLEIKLAPGQPKEVAQQALKDAEEATNRFPLSRALARQYADAMINAGKFEDATRYLREQVRQYREDAKLYDLLAKAYSKQGKIALQHMALAESYVLAGALPAAVDQLNNARKASDVSFYDQSVIDAREREIKKRQKEEKEDEKER
ncbi:M48 family metalloprotease [Massilia litorea]|uniref:M48 family metallopeptidase n=1 Tax=Massilia litorea TaxID=2769491 RepID=A0A7L9UAD1_9BURK|nr:M48 family metalloprotease [Massilia litorea]QOL51928.1 M48 family metallopeptidase [Massilia litorea]